ncbi:hypothetical protein AwWohl_00600 [Gammaproteobacteria bacterium]|nr:hypothetical protein AwWohl_00600 [Gammaproteobacteria bacterium]
MFKKILSHKKSGVDVRVEPGLNNQFGETSIYNNELPSSVFNVRNLTEEINIDDNYADIKTNIKTNNINLDFMNKHEMNPADFANSFEPEIIKEREENEILKEFYLTDSALKNSELSDNHLTDSDLKDSDLAGSDLKQEYSNPKKASFFGSVFKGIASFFGKKNKHSTTRLSKSVSSYNIKRPKPTETIALILAAPENSPYLGQEIFSVIHNFELPLSIGNEGFLEQITTTYFGEEVEFSIASMLHPGSFDVPNINQMKIPGILFFMDIPTADHQKDTFEQMLKVAARFGNELGGSLLDQDKKALDAKSVQTLRNYIDKQDELLWEQAELESE